MVRLISKNKNMRQLLPALALLTLLPPAFAAMPTSAQGPRIAPPVTQLIVKFKAPAGASLMEPAAAQRAFAMTTNRLQALSAAAGVPLTYRRPMSGNAQVVKLPYAMDEQQAEVIATQLKQSPDKFD